MRPLAVGEFPGAVAVGGVVGRGLGVVVTAEGLGDVSCGLGVVVSAAEGLGAVGVLGSGEALVSGIDG